MNLNYQNKMKEIIDYLLQISETKNSHIKELIDVKLESVKTFVERKENATEFIDHVLNFNVELCKLSQHFDNQFSMNMHSEFNRSISSILATESKYEVSDVDIALQQEVLL